MSDVVSVQTGAVCFPDSYIGNMIEQEKIEEIQQLLLDGYGYSRLKAILDTVSTDGLPEEVTEFIATLPDLQVTILSIYIPLSEEVTEFIATLPDLQVTILSIYIPLSEEVTEFIATLPDLQVTILSCFI